MGDVSKKDRGGVPTADKGEVSEDVKTEGGKETKKVNKYDKGEVFEREKWSRFADRHFQNYPKETKKVQGKGALIFNQSHS